VPRTEDPQPALGAAVRELRTQKGITQEDLAHLAGVRTGAISLLERGRSNPAWGTVRRIAQALGVSVADLARRADELDR
jgi:XRE family transcriptional regulator, regulator of sulfur utilization